MNQCPHPDCTRQIPQNRFACGEHWWGLPKRLRAAVWRGYRHAQAKGDWERWTKTYSEAKKFWQNEKVQN